MRTNFGCLLIIILSLLTSRSWGAPLPSAQRVASLSVGADEIVWELLRGERQRIVGLSHLARDGRYSSVADEIPHKLAILSHNLEPLVRLKPDLVIAASYNRAETITHLKSLGIDILILENFRTIPDILENIALVGKKLGKVESAEKLIAAQRNALKKISLRAKSRKRIPTLLNFSPDQSVWGRDTLFNDMVELAGAHNLVAAEGITGWPILSLEKIAKFRPDCIVTEGEEADRAQVLAQLKSQPGWETMPAVKNGKLILLRPRLLHAVSHHLIQAVDDLSRALDAC